MCGGSFVNVVTDYLYVCSGFYLEACFLYALVAPIHQRGGFSDTFLLTNQQLIETIDILEKNLSATLAVWGDKKQLHFSFDESTATAYFVRYRPMLDGLFSQKMTIVFDKQQQNALLKLFRVLLAA